MARVPSERGARLSSLQPRSPYSRRGGRGWRRSAPPFLPLRPPPRCAGRLAWLRSSTLSRPPAPYSLSPYSSALSSSGALSARRSLVPSLLLSLSLPALLSFLAPRDRPSLFLSAPSRSLSTVSFRFFLLPLRALSGGYSRFSFSRRRFSRAANFLPCYFIEFSANYALSTIVLCNLLFSCLGAACSFF